MKKTLKAFDDLLNSNPTEIMLHHVNKHNYDTQPQLQKGK